MTTARAAGDMPARLSSKLEKPPVETARCQGCHQGHGGEDRQDQQQLTDVLEDDQRPSRKHEAVLTASTHDPGNGSWEVGRSSPCRIQKVRDAVDWNAHPGGAVVQLVADLVERLLKREEPNQVARLLRRRRERR
jgi:hypothetical protein